MRALAALAAAAVAYAGHAAECGANEEPKIAPPPFDYASLEGGTSAAPAASSATPVMSAASRADADARIATLNSLGAALVASDSKAFAALYTDDAVVVIPGVSEWKGREDIGYMHRKIFHAMDDIKWAAVRVFIGRNAAAVEWGMTGVHARDWLGVPATKKAVSVWALSVYRFGAGAHVKEEHTYFDAATIYAQIGASAKGVEAGPMPPMPASPEVLFATGDPDEDAAVALNVAAGKAMEDRSTDAYLATMQEDFTKWTTASAEPTRGRDAELRGFEARLKSIPDRKAKVDVFGVGRFAIVEVAFSGTNVAPIGSWPATKKPVTIHVGAITELDPTSKKLAREWLFSNRVELLSQLGAKFGR